MARFFLPSAPMFSAAAPVADSGEIFCGYPQFERYLFYFPVLKP